MMHMVLVVCFRRRNRSNYHLPAGGTAALARRRLGPHHRARPASPTPATARAATPRRPRATGSAPSRATSRPSLTSPRTMRWSRKISHARTQPRPRWKRVERTAGWSSARRRHAATRGALAPPAQSSVQHRPLLLGDGCRAFRAVGAVRAVPVNQSAMWRLESQDGIERPARGDKGDGTHVSFTEDLHFDYGEYEGRLDMLRGITQDELVLRLGRGEGTRGPASSKFRGVSWAPRDRRWKARFNHNGKQTSLGNFVNEEEALRAFDRMAVCSELHGVERRGGWHFNFPRADYEGESEELRGITMENLREKLRQRGREQRVAANNAEGDEAGKSGSGGVSGGVELGGIDVDELGEEGAGGDGMGRGVGAGASAEARHQASPATVNNTEGDEAGEGTGGGGEGGEDGGEDERGIVHLYMHAPSASVQCTGTSVQERSKQSGVKWSDPGWRVQRAPAAGRPQRAAAAGRPQRAPAARRPQHTAATRRPQRAPTAWSTAEDGGGDTGEGSGGGRGAGRRHCHGRC